MVLWRVADFVHCCCAGAKTTFGQYGGWFIKLLWFGSAVDFHVNIWTQIAPEFFSAFNQFAPQSCEAGPALLVCIPVNIRVNMCVYYYILFLYEMLNICRSKVDDSLDNISLLLIPNSFSCLCMSYQMCSAVWNSILLHLSIGKTQRQHSLQTNCDLFLVLWPQREWWPP